MKSNNFLTILVAVAMLVFFACDEGGVTTHTDAMDDEEYSSAIVYLPKGTGPFHAVSVSGGLTNTKENMEWVSEPLSENGYIVIAFTAEYILTTSPFVYERGHNAAIEKLKSENSRPGSPLYGKVDTNNMSMLGYSMGGGGVIKAAQNNVTGINAIVAIAPWENCTLTLGIVDCGYESDEISIPTAVIAGDGDYIAGDLTPMEMYDAIPGSVDRLGLIFEGMGHLTFVDGFGSGSNHDKTMSYILAFLKVHLSGDSSYQDTLDGARLQKNIDAEWFKFYEYNGTRHVSID